MFPRPKKFSYEEELAYCIQTIEDFLAGSGGDWDWDDFISIPIPFAELEAVRGFCLELPTRYPPKDRAHWCNAEGLAALKERVQELKTRSGDAGAGRR